MYHINNSITCFDSVAQYNSCIYLHFNLLTDTEVNQLVTVGHLTRHNELPVIFETARYAQSTHCAKCNSVRVLYQQCIIRYGSKIIERAVRTANACI